MLDLFLMAQDPAPAFFLGGFLSAIANLAGAFLGAKSDENAKDANVAMSAADREMQREFAQQGVRWRVADAQAAGIHPLYALGANTPSASPSAIAVQGSDSWQRGLHDMGNSIDRAIESKQTERERLGNRLLLAQIEGQEIENSFKASQIALRSGPQMPPAFPASGQVKMLPDEVTSSWRGDAAMTAGIKPATTQFVNRDGSVTIWPSPDAKQSIEDSMYEWEHMWRNRVVPYWQGVGRDVRGLFN